MRLRPLRILAFLALSGCATTQVRDKMEQLQESVEAYNEAYRWKNFERAASFLPNDQRAAFVSTYEDDEKSLHVEDCQVLKIDMDGSDAAAVMVRVRYMLLPSVTVETRKVVQHWHLVNKQWVLETEDNSIRKLNMDLSEPPVDEFGGAGAQPNDDLDQQIQVTDPKGNVIREDTHEDQPFPTDPE